MLPRNLQDLVSDSGRAEGQQQIHTRARAGGLVSHADLERRAAEQSRQGPGGLSSEADFLPGGSRAPVPGVSQAFPGTEGYIGHERRPGDLFAPDGEPNTEYLQTALALTGGGAPQDRPDQMRQLQRSGFGLMAPTGMSFMADPHYGRGEAAPPPAPGGSRNPGPSAGSAADTRLDPAGGDAPPVEGDGGPGSEAPFYDPTMSAEARRIALELNLGINDIDRRRQRLIEDANLFRPHMERQMRNSMSARANNVAGRGFHGMGSGVMGSVLGDLSADHAWTRGQFERGVSRAEEDLEQALMDLIMRSVLEGGESVLGGAGRSANDIIANLGW